MEAAHLRTKAWRMGMALVGLPTALLGIPAASGLFQGMEVLMESQGELVLAMSKCAAGSDVTLHRLELGPQCHSTESCLWVIWAQEVQRRVVLKAGGVTALQVKSRWCTLSDTIALGEGLRHTSLGTTECDVHVEPGQGRGRPAAHRTVALTGLQL